MPLLGQWSITFDKNITSFSLDFRPTPLIYVLVIVLCVINLITIIAVVICFSRIRANIKMLQEQHTCMCETLQQATQQRRKISYKHSYRRFTPRKPYKREASQR